MGQAYGINLATNETDVFFQRFLFPTLLKQDPRYFRNPDLPFFQRALYAMSRVLITRTDSGGQTFNSSRILSIAASRAVSDLYVPGERQGMHPIAGLRQLYSLARCRRESICMSSGQMFAANSCIAKVNRQRSSFAFRPK